jgi:PTH2 family peptidyl-tRNA hydrolase
MTEYVKQVIVVRKDLKMPKGKIAAHAAMAPLLKMMDKDFGTSETEGWMLRFKHGSALDSWLNGSYTKVCLGVEDEEQLLALFAAAEQAGLPCALIRDNGLTVFNGVPTNTCIAIGPDYESKINSITGHLPLL